MNDLTSLNLVRDSLTLGAGFQWKDIHRQTASIQNRVSRIHCSSRQLEVLFAYQLSHLSAEVEVGVYIEFLVGGGVDPAFVGSHGDIDGALALVMFADALYLGYPLFGHLPGVEAYLDLCG